MTTTMNTGAASLSDEQKRAAITACALMIKGICLTTPNAEWTERIENRIHYLLRQIATTPQADAAPSVAEKFVPDAAMNFAAYLIDNCENEVVREESVQAWLGKMLTSPRYHPAAPSVEQDERGVCDRYQVLNEAGEALLAANHGEAYEVIYRMMKDARAASTSANVAQGSLPVVTAVYRAASDCPYVGASEDIKCAWADGWNQCAQFTKGSHEGY